VAFALPLPFLAVALFLYRMRRLLYLQGVCLPLLLFLLGFVLPFPTSVAEGQPKLRVMTLNVDSGYAGYERIVPEIVKRDPDVVVMQEAFGGQPTLVSLLGAHYPHAAWSTQFVIASRFPILKTFEPSHLSYYNYPRSPRFIHYQLATSLGEIALYSVHPASPRGVLRLNRLRGAFHNLRTGKLLAGNPAYDVGVNTGLRLLQVRTIAERAAREERPVVIAGDFNLPELSPAFRQTFGSYRDAFREAGWGLGYTYPSKHPWLRLDHILVSPSLRVGAVEVECKGFSDHRCIIADIQKR
jgi:endonuclease/exonuclease/phosphatase (EEP) superfamily protein YafD